jgi:hypothetical protein
LDPAERAVGLGQALDRRHGMPIGGRGEHQAGSDRLAVHEDSATSADAVLAPHMGTGKTEVVTQEVRQEASRLDGRAPLYAVHHHRDVEALPVLVCVT